MSFRGGTCHEPKILLPLVEKSELLTLRANGRINVSEKLPQPVDEFDIPRRIDVVRQALATVAVDHVWAGAYDLHHLAYHEETYKSITRGDERVGSMYRGASRLKVIIPRQLHDYIHAIFEVPSVPDEAVMRQLGVESNDVHNLYNTVRIGNYEKIPELAALPFEVQEKNRQNNFLKKLEVLPSSQLGLFPNPEILAAMELDQARKILRGLARASGFSNVPSCQDKFFSGV